MIIKLTLIGLIIVLMGVITMSYYVNEEGFDDISNGYFSNLSNDLSGAMNTVSSDVSSATSNLSGDVNNAMNAVSSATSNLGGDVNNAMNAVSSDISSATNNLSGSVNNAMNTVSSDILSPTNNLSGSVNNNIIPEVSISGSGYNAMNLQQKSDLLNDIQKVVRNDILASRSTTPVLNNGGNCKVTDSVSQGQEYVNNCYKDTEYRCPKNPDGSCPPMPDMSQYIKKDAIPCFGCALDY